MSVRKTHARQGKLVPWRHEVTPDTRLITKRKFSGNSLCIGTGYRRLIRLI